MTIQAIRLADGNTTIELDTDTGTLTERGQQFPVLHRPVEDSFAILKLLLMNKNHIIREFQKSKTKMSPDDIRVSAQLDGLPSESGGHTGAVSGVEIDKDLKGKQPGMIGKSRGA